MEIIFGIIIVAVKLLQEYFARREADKYADKVVRR